MHKLALQVLTGEGEIMQDNSTQSKKQLFGSGALVVLAFAIAALVIASAATFLTPQKAYAYGFTSKTSTTNSITVTWDDPNASYSSLTTTAYAIGWADALEASDTSKINTQLLDASARSFTITNLKPGTRYVVALTYQYRTSSNAVSTGTAARDYALSTRVVKPTGVMQTSWSYKANTAYFTWDIQTGAKKVECRLLNAANGKTLLSRTFSSLTKDFYVYGLNKKYMYAVQMRVQDEGGWSAWSNKMYFLSQPLTNYKTKVAKNQLVVSWDKVKGAQKYAVYVSTKKKSGYKKVATVKSTRSTTVVKKFAKKKISAKKTYYVYVQATKKVGGKTFTSGKHYAYKVRGSKGSTVYPF